MTKLWVPWEKKKCTREVCVGWRGRIQCLYRELINSEQVAFKYWLLPLSRYIDSINIC